MSTLPASSTRIDGAAPYGGPRAHCLQPSPHVRELIGILPLPLPARGPADAGDVGDRVIGARKERMPRESPLHDAIEFRLHSSV